MRTEITRARKSGNKLQVTFDDDSRETYVTSPQLRRLVGTALVTASSDLPVSKYRIGGRVFRCREAVSTVGRLVLSQSIGVYYDMLGTTMYMHRMNAIILGLGALVRSKSGKSYYFRQGGVLSAVHEAVHAWHDVGAQDMNAAADEAKAYTTQMLLAIARDRHKSILKEFAKENYLGVGTIHKAAYRAAVHVIQTDRKSPGRGEVGKENYKRLIAAFGPSVYDEDHLRTYNGVPRKKAKVRRNWHDQMKSSTGYLGR